MERLRQFLGHETKVEALLIGMSDHAAETLGESLSIAVSASRANLGATTDWIPSSIRPFDTRTIAHMRA